MISGYSLARRVLRLAVALIAIGVLSQALAEGQPLKQLNIGFQKANILALLKARGTLDEALKKQGIAIRWTEFTAGPQMLEGLNIGSIDLAATGDAPPAFAQAAKADLIYLAHNIPNPKTEAILVPKDSTIQSVADLKGKRVALNKGSDVNYLLVEALKKAGLSYHDITPVYLVPSDARAAFQRGSVDAWVIWDPLLRRGRNQRRRASPSERRGDSAALHLLSCQPAICARPSRHCQIDHRTTGSTEYLG